jgi:hypothetical protein
VDSVDWVLPGVSGPGVLGQRGHQDDEVEGEGAVGQLLALGLVASDGGEGDGAVGGDDVLDEPVAVVVVVTGLSAGQRRETFAVSRDGCTGREGGDEVVVTVR